MSIPRNTATPLPIGASIVQALDLFVQGDPVASLYASSLLKAFGQQPGETTKEQIAQLLALWEQVMPASPLGEKPQPTTIIEKARGLL